MSDTDDADDTEPYRQVKERYANGTVFTGDELQHLARGRNLRELAYLVTVYRNEAFAFLFDPDLALRRTLEFATAITTCLAETDGATFGKCLNESFTRYHAHDEKLMNRLPDFDYIATGDGAKTTVTFPGDAT